MKRILKWFASKFSPRSPADEADERHTLAGATSEDGVPEDQDQLDHTATHPTLTILGESPITVEESDDFDPYNSGSFESTKSSSRN